jgi:hypothetical protein
MKGFITLSILSISLSLSAQTIKFNVHGTVKITKNAKYAYLSTLSQQIPISSPKIFIVAPIVNGHFQLSGKFDLEGKILQYGCVFLDERGDITKEELQLKFKELVWVTGRDSHLRKIILENLGLEIEQRDQMIASKIISGGIMTKQLDEQTQAIKAGNRKFIEYIKKYPDSPVSLAAVMENNSVFYPPKKEKHESWYGLPLESYLLLSPRLKHSKEGVQLKKDIDQKATQ